MILTIHQKYMISTCFGLLAGLITINMISKSSTHKLTKEEQDFNTNQYNKNDLVYDNTGNVYRLIPVQTNKENILKLINKNIKKIDDHIFTDESLNNMENNRIFSDIFSKIKYEGNIQIKIIEIFKSVLYDLGIKILLNNNREEGNDREGGNNREEYNDKEEGNKDNREENNKENREENNKDNINSINNKDNINNEYNINNGDNINSIYNEDNSINNEYYDDYDNYNKNIKINIPNTDRSLLLDYRWSNKDKIYENNSEEEYNKSIWGDIHKNNNDSYKNDEFYDTKLFFGINSIDNVKEFSLLVDSLIFILENPKEILKYFDMRMIKDKKTRFVTLLTNKNTINYRYYGNLEENLSNYLINKKIGKDEKITVGGREISLLRHVLLCLRISIINI